MSILMTQSKLKNKWRNYGLLLSIASTIGLVFKEHLPQDYIVIVENILGILVVLGIVSNPSIGRGYADVDRRRQ